MVVPLLHQSLSLLCHCTCTRRRAPLAPLRPGQHFTAPLPQSGMHGPPKLHPTLTSFTALTHFCPSLTPKHASRHPSYCLPACPALPCPALPGFNGTEKQKQPTTTAQHTHASAARLSHSAKTRKKDRHTHFDPSDIGRILFLPLHHHPETVRLHSVISSCPLDARPPPSGSSCRDIECVTGSPAVLQPSSGPVAATAPSPACLPGLPLSRRR